MACDFPVEVLNGSFEIVSEAGDMLQPARDSQHFLSMDRSTPLYPRVTCRTSLSN